MNPHSLNDPGRNPARVRGIGLPIAAALGFIAMLATSGPGGEIQGLVFWGVLAVSLVVQAVVLLIISSRPTLRPLPTSPEQQQRDRELIAEVRVERRARLLALRRENLERYGNAHYGQLE